MTGDPRPAWFVCTGMGSQWPGMARDMMQIPTFQQTIMKLTDVLRYCGIDLYDVIMNCEPSVLENTVISFSVIAAVQV